MGCSPEVEIYLIRHGETEWNASGRFQGKLDSALTVNGIAQAEACGRRLAGISPAVSAFFASPLGRVRHTASIVSSFGAYPQTLWEDRLAEVSIGSWDGLTHIDMGVFVVGAQVLVDALGLDLTALKLFSGAFGLAVGFGLQRTFGNLIAGLILLMDKSVKPGDVIVVGDTFGAINRIGIRAVSVLTRDGKEHLIPNELLMTEPVENWSYSSRNVRIRIPVGVSYASDLPTAQRLMIEAASKPERVLADPAPRVWLKGFGDSSVDHEILVWISDPEDGVGNVQSEILNALWLLFKENGVEIPFPQLDVHIRTMLAPDRNGLP